MSGQSEMVDFRNTFGFLLLCAGVWCSHAVSFDESGDVMCVIMLAQYFLGGSLSLTSLQGHYESAEKAQEWVM